MKKSIIFNLHQKINKKVKDKKAKGKGKGFSYDQIKNRYSRPKENKFSTYFMTNLKKYCFDKSNPGSYFQSQYQQQFLQFF